MHHREQSESIVKPLRLVIHNNDTCALFEFVKKWCARNKFCFRENVTVSYVSNGSRPAFIRAEYTDERTKIRGSVDFEIIRFLGEPAIVIEDIQP